MIGWSKTATTSHWRLALLVLLCAAVSQVALAGHQFQHDDILSSESCTLCVQVEQLDAPTSVAGISVAFAPGAVLEPCGEIAAAQALTAFYYQSRAPPVH